MNGVGGLRREPAAVAARISEELSLFFFYLLVKIFVLTS
jgi:hypothetical protein